MSTQPAYQAAPVIGAAAFSTANTARDGSGTIGTLVVGRNPGTRIEKVMVKASGTTTGGMVRIFKRDNGLTLNADGTVASFATPTWRLIYELPVTAITPSATLAAFAGEWAPDGGITLAPHESLGVATHNAETFNAFAVGGHL